jgi:hypothetical protein
MSIKILNKSFTIDEIINLIEACGRNSVKDTKRIYENLMDGLLSNIKSLTAKNLSDLLHSIAKYNLTEVYENNPFYIQFLLKFNEATFKDLLKETPKLVWTLSSFALRSKEYNPIFKYALEKIPYYLNTIEGEVSTADLKHILQSLSVAELLMKFNLTTVDFRETFDAELISSLLNLYIHRVSSDPDFKFSYLNGIFIESFGNSNNFEKTYTNLYSGNVLTYKDKTFPVILVISSELNMDGKLLGEDYINYHHLKSFSQTNPMIVDLTHVKDRFDFEREFQSYSKHPQTGYKKMLD